MVLINHGSLYYGLGHPELVSGSQAIDNEILKQVQDDSLDGKTDF